MSLSLNVGETAYPLDATLITGRATQTERKQIRWAADPLLAKLTNFLAAVVNSELQAALTAVRSEQPDTMQVIVTHAIPAAPERFLFQISRENLPILCVYRTAGTHAADTVGSTEKVTNWRAEYCMPELEAWELGSLLGLDNAIIDAMAQALKVGHHSAYNSDEAIDEDLEDDIAPGDFEFLNWNPPGQNGGILFPAVRLAFTTVEAVTPNNADGTRVPLEEMGVTYGLPKESDDQDDLSNFVDSNVVFFLIESVTADGTELSVTLSKAFDEDTLPNFPGWRLHGTESNITGYGTHSATVIVLNLDQALEAAEIGVATLRLVRYGEVLTAADGIGAIEEHDPVVITAP